MKQRNISLLTYFVLAIFVTSCKTHYEDDFYNFTYNIHGRYLPILKPYMIYLEGDYPSYIDLQKHPQVKNILAIDVQDSLIFIKSNNTSEMDEVCQKYFLIEYFHGDEQGFYTEDQLLEYVRKKKYKKPNWQDVDKIWEKVDSGNYPWNIKLDSMYQKRQIIKAS